MAAQVIGSVTSPSNGKRYDVKWNPSGKDAYVSYAGWTALGSARSADEALQKAVAFLARQ